MLDSDLAKLYEVETRTLTQAVKRKIKRFPDDFMFQLSKNEYDRLRSQFVISKKGGRTYLPYAFTENGVAMLSSVLNSEKAIQVNIQIMRAFTTFKKLVSYAEYLELKEKHAELRDAVIAILGHEKEQNKAIESLSEEIQFFDSKNIMEFDRVDRMLRELKSRKIEIVIIHKDDQKGK